MHHLVATVVPGGYLPASVIVGLPILAYFKQVTFDKSQVTLSRAVTQCNSPIPMTFATSPDQGGHLVFAARADGMTVNGMFDTGRVSCLRRVAS